MTLCNAREGRKQSDVTHCKLDRDSSGEQSDVTHCKLDRDSSGSSKT